MVLKDGEVMSKSRGNIVDPDKIIKKYGADTLRLFILFAAPPETELDWNERAINGAFKFLSRVWNLIALSGEKNSSPLKIAQDAALERKIHQTIKKVSEDIEERFHFNTAISAIMELVNEIYRLLEEKKEITSLSAAIQTVILLLAPFTPHICEEMWQRLGKSSSLAKVSWPEYDARLICTEKINIVVQVNGKLRAKIEVDAGTSDEKLKTLALAEEKIKNWIKQSAVKKVIVVSGKLVNIVT
jgi:leucyl-tRNA synthetase